MTGMIDNYDLWLEHDNQAETWLESLPVCSICGEHIQDDYYYQLGDEIICESCMEDYRVSNDAL